MQISNSIISINNTTTNDVRSTDIEQQSNNIQPSENLGFTSRHLIRIFPSTINRIINNNPCKMIALLLVFGLVGLALTVTKFLLNYVFNKEAQSLDIAFYVFFSYSILLSSSIIIIKSFSWMRTKLYNRNIISEVANISYKKLDKYEGSIEEFNNKLSVINLEELNSKSLKDPIVYDKQFYSFKEFKKALLINGKIPHNGLEIKPSDIKNIKKLEVPSDNTQKI